ncbi:OmpA family protein [Scleromatobacter humisilvae]|uniref:OmpA family protein n=1 Tax=Scleromatobacter humisilvae TaxID=2897159 RepID=A0A9X2BXI5_9BURK|nr:OmpA family protein [Scleromatobacter humisilvae]MCK9684452.1 OmpA family protein [Scleromatobacter humisilvae]
MTRQKSLAINVLAAAAALACIGTASAQENTYNPNAYILLNGSVMKPDSKFPEDKVGYGGGVKIGVPLNPSWDIQVGGNYAESKDHGLKMHEYLGGVDALYLFTPAGFRPFVLVGLGASRDSGTTIDRHTSPYVNAGVGFQYKFTPTLGMQADIRETDSFYRHRDPFDGMKNSANTYVNVGLTWAFGAPPVAAPVPVATTTRTEETTTVTTPPPAPVYTPPPPPPPAPVMKKYTLSASELFAFNSAKLGPNQPKLDEVATTMQANSDIASVTIVGYTDRIGSKAYNQKLSEERANSVKSYLEGKGVAANRLTAVGKGEADPVVECKDEKKRPALIKCLEPNRRVEIEPVTFTKQVN